MDPRLVETTCVDLTECIEHPLVYHRCAATTTTSSTLETILPIIQQYLFCGHGGTMGETTKSLRTCLFALQATQAEGHRDYVGSCGVRIEWPLPQAPAQTVSPNQFRCRRQAQQLKSTEFDILLQPPS
ncbi:hypothetical protein MTO96_037940 [Rhipicephalus appendiculatus]